MADGKASESVGGGGEGSSAGAFSLFDIPGLGFTSDDDEEDPIPGTSRSAGQGATSARGSSSRGISTVPSGSGLAFLMDSSFEEDNPRNLIGGEFEDDEDDELDADTSYIGTKDPLLLAGRRAAGAEGGGSGEGSIVVRRERELTDKYLAGQISFKDFVSEINQESEDDDDDQDGEEEDDNLDDAEWKPSKKARMEKAVPILDESHQSQFEAELDQTRRQQLSKKKKKVGSTPRRKRLDPALQGLMGEANLRFARGDKDTAVRMCMEVIRQDPMAPEPFQTLSTLYEETGEQERSVQFALIAAHLAPQDPEEWARLADMSMEMDDLQQAAVCYKKAIDADVGNLRFHWARCSLLEQLGDEKAALRGYRRLLGVLKENQGSEYLQASKDIARILHERKDVEGAKKAITEAMKKHPQHVGSEDVNLLLELLISLDQIDDALHVLCKHCSVMFSTDRDDEEEKETMAVGGDNKSSGKSEKKTPSVAELPPEQQLERFKKVLVPEETPLDIRSKLVVVLVNLKAKHLVKDICQTILESDPEEFGDLMLDISEAFMSQEHHEEAVRYLEKLVHSREYGQAAVWLRYGESLLATGRLDESEQAYQRVVELAPSHAEARRTLSGILHKLGRAEEALHTLTQDEAAELLNPTLLYERCQLLHSENCTEDFIGKAKLLFSRHFVNIRNREELHAIASSKRLSVKNKALSEVRAFRREPMREEGGPNFENQSEISAKDEYELFRKLCNVLYEQRRYGELQRVTFSAMGSPYFNKSPDIVKECEFLCLLSSFLNGDSYLAFNIVREMAGKHLKNARFWNLLNLVIMRADDIRHNRFLMRLMSRNPDNLALGILNGHNCLVAGTYKYSLGEYMTAFKQDPDNPMIALMLGLTFTHMACQKFTAKKHSLVVQSCAFLHQYLKLRGPCQESYYNLGRAMHQLGLLPAALFYYKKALALPPTIVDSADIFDLSREAAFNISIIYQNSGAPDLARMYTQKYIVV